MRKSGQTYIPLLPFQIKIKHFGLGEDMKYKNAIYLECADDNKILIFEYSSAPVGVER